MTREDFNATEKEWIENKIPTMFYIGELQLYKNLLEARIAELEDKNKVLEYNNMRLESELTDLETSNNKLYLRVCDLEDKNFYCNRYEPKENDNG